MRSYALAHGDEQRNPDRVPHVSPLRGDVRARAASRRPRDHARARRPGRRVQSRVPLPEGHRAEAARGRSRSDPPAARAATATRSTKCRGTRRSRRSTPGSRRSASSTAPTRSRCTSATRARTISPGLVYSRVLLQAARTKNVFSASTVDQMPKQVSAGLMFGGALTIPVPDVDRTDYLLMLGANPYASNGSLMTAPDMPGRLAGAARPRRQARRRRSAPHEDRGGSRRTPPDPARDRRPLPVRARARAVRRRPRRPRRRSPRTSNGLDDVAPPRRSRSRPKQVAPACGIDAATIRRIAHELAARADRRGVRPHRHVHAGVRHARVVARRRAERVHRQPRPARRRDVHQRGDRRPRAAATGKGRGVTFGRRTSRVRGLPEFFGELPVVCLAEEIETPGDGQIRALVTLAGNPAMSDARTPIGSQTALPTLDFMVSIDIYLNETTRHAERDPAAGTGARTRSLRPRALQPRDPQRRELFAAARRARARRGPGVAHDAAARGCDRRAGRARRRRRARRSRRRPVSSARRSRRRGSNVEGRDADEIDEGARDAARARSACSTSCCAPARTATGSAPIPTGSRSRSSKPIRTASTSVRCSRASPRCCARRRG